MNRDAAIEAVARVLEDERRIRHDEDCEQDPDAIAPGCRCARRAAAAVIDAALPHLVGEPIGYTVMSDAGYITPKRATLDEARRIHANVTGVSEDDRYRVLALVPVVEP